MPRRIDPKCLANTLKSTNSKRPVEEISQCTRFALSELITGKKLDLIY